MELTEKPPVGQVPAAEAQDKAERVQQMFAAISGRYDLLNRVLSLGVDQSWRREAAHAALVRAPRRVLDVATGTADFALGLKRLSPHSEVIGCDFVPQMLEIGRQKARQQNLDIALEQEDALSLSYPDSSFEALTCAFGFRNFADYVRGLEEFYRVLAPGGRVVILEFPPPRADALGQLYRLYFEKVLPRIGGLISGNAAAYSYLPESVKAFPPPQQLKTLMEAAGFRTQYRLLSFGIAALHIGVKE